METPTVPFTTSASLALALLLSRAGGRAFGDPDGLAAAD
jgi:hypothetical protein